MINPAPSHSCISNPEQVLHSLSCDEVLSGAVEWYLVLHHPGQFPSGAIGPTRVMWIPSSSTTDIEGGGGHGGTCSNEEKKAMEGRDNSSSKEGKEVSCWIWIHAAAVHEAKAALEAACISIGLTGVSQVRFFHRTRFICPF